MIRSVCVFLGSSTAAAEPFRRLAREAGAAIAGAGWELVYGGASCGPMGELADAALGAGGRVTGVIPRPIVDRELAHRGLTQLVTVETMHERKARMAARSDAVAVLPGGYGTLDEAFEALTWRQLGLHQKPVVFVDPPDAPYWEPLLAWVRTGLDARLLRPEHAAFLERVVGAEALVARLSAEPPHPGLSRTPPV